MKKALELPPEEIERQSAAMREFAALDDRPRTYCVVTYGCQMNAHDSETIEGMLCEMGMTPAKSREQADFVLFNTCCVRDNAQRRALGNVLWIKELKKRRPEMMLAVCGCMMQQPGMGEQVLRQYPFVDLAFGTHNLYRFPQLLLTAVKSRRRVVEVPDGEEGIIPEDLPVRRSSPHRAYITIMYGCNNFCSYCIVPYVRGRERSRASDRIIEEAKQLRSEGVKEIMLLGQNVNSYGLDREGEMSFAQLLRALDGVGIERIRFMTSHPKDISSELIDVMASSKHVCHALHLPVQHGSDRVLQSMNRKYTREEYMQRVAQLRVKVPDISLTTDLIVGYPGETEEEFEQTCTLVEQVGYDSAYTFIFSPRAGTRAADMPDQIPAEVSSRRIQKLISIQKGITQERYARYVGQVQSVLVDELSKRDEAQVAGKNEYNITVNFPGSAELIGQIVRVRITSTGESTLRGERI